VRLAGKEVARIGLGTNRLRTTQQDVDFIRAAVEAGIGMVDTAHLYTGGESEEAIGRAGVTGRDDLVVATKGGFGRGGQGRPEALNAQIDESLQRLRTDAIDLYYLHRVDPETPLEESLGAIKARVDAGDIRHVGLSEVTVDQLEHGRAVVEIAAVQNEYNRGQRKHDPVLDHCTAQGIAFVPYYPLRGEDDAAEALRWMLDRSPVVFPIPGTRSIEHLRENLQALS
jgi:pyridoxine 4-dehydrogenase